MQSRLFTIFLTLTISPPLIQQLQPVFLNSRNIFSSRENNSKIYSWLGWTTAAILPEIPYSIFAGTIYYFCWWWAPIGYRATSFQSGYIYLASNLPSNPSIYFRPSGKTPQISNNVPELTGPLGGPTLRALLRRLRPSHRRLRPQRTPRLPPGPPLLPLRRLLLWRPRATPSPPRLLALLDVLAIPVPLPPRGHARRRRARHPRPLRHLGTRALHASPRRDLSELRGSVHQQSGRVCTDGHGWAVRVLRVRDGRRVREGVLGVLRASLAGSGDLCGVHRVQLCGGVFVYVGEVQGEESAQGCVREVEEQG